MARTELHGVANNNVRNPVAIHVAQVGAVVCAGSLRRARKRPIAVPHQHVCGRIQRVVAAEQAAVRQARVDVQVAVAIQVFHRHVARVVDRRVTHPRRKGPIPIAQIRVYGRPRIHHQVQLSVIIDVAACHPHAESTRIRRRIRKRRRAHRRKRPAPVVQQHRAVRADDVLPPKASRVRRNQPQDRRRRIARISRQRRSRKALRRLERPIPIPQQHADLLRVAHRNDIQLAIAVHIVNHRRHRHVSCNRIIHRRLKRSIAIPEQHRDVCAGSVVVVHHYQVADPIAIQVCRRKGARRCQTGDWTELNRR